MENTIIFNDEVRSKILAGITKLNDAVKITLGSKGRNVVIQRSETESIITKDGVTVANSIHLNDTFEDMGATMVKQVAGKTVFDAGDGTTTATVLAEGIYREGLKYILAGANPMDLKRGIDLAVDIIVEELDKIAIDVSDSKALEQIGTISANGDVEIGQIIANAMSTVGNDGTISVTESRTSETSLNIVEGMQFNRGYLSPYFITNKGNMSVEMQDPLILVTNRIISSLQDILPIMQMVSKLKRPLFIIAEDVDTEVLSALVVNNMRGSLKVCAVKAPEFGDVRKDMLEDIAILTGATYISNTLVKSFDNFAEDDFGSAKSIKCTATSTVVIDGGGDVDCIKERVNEIKVQKDLLDNPDMLAGINRRIAKLASGVAVISVGSATELELNEKKDRLEDALNATRAAVSEGVVVGGGIALFRVSKTLTDGFTSNSDINSGISIVRNACNAPVRQIISNAGGKIDVIIDILEQSEFNIGYNASSDEYVNMLDAGIIDPKKVTRCGIQNAASIAGMLLTTECMIPLQSK